MKWYKYQLHTTTQETELFGELLCELGINGFEVSDHVPISKKDEKKMYTDIPADLGPDDGKATITFYTEAEEEDEFYSTGSSLRDERLEKSEIVLPEQMIARIKESVEKCAEYAKLSVPEITYVLEDDSAWKDKWKENFKPFHVADDIIVKPSWEEVPDDYKDGDILIEIDPGSAFGTGTHETTKLCLLSLRKYISKDTKIMDAGCGSGILAIAALLCGAKSAFCMDIDPSAVTGTIENAKLNQLDESRITAVHGNILENPEEILNQCGGNFDVAVANILADVIIPLASEIGAFIKQDGIFISSGILAEKADDVEKALTENAFEIMEKNTMGDWVSFVARKA